MTTQGVRYVWLATLSWCVVIACCGEHPDGISQVSREQDSLGNYQFGYTINNHEGEQFRKEGTDSLGRVIGSYGLKNVDGTHRVVDYVADKHGFRAEVRSNEPGVASAESADASIIRTDGQPPLAGAASVISQHVPLSVAETSQDNSRATFGKRLNTETSKVAYVAPDINQKPPDEIVRESRQHNFDDYRPLSPVAYYPGEAQNPSVPLNPPIRRPVDIHSSSLPLAPPPRRPAEAPRAPRVLTQIPESDSKPLDVYLPPIDPHTAIRRPGYYSPPRERDTRRNSYPTTTSHRPFIPPYGGFDDDPLPEDKIPAVTMTTIHGGVGRGRSFPTRIPNQSFGSRDFPPSGGIPDQSDFDLSRFPISSRYPSGFGPPSAGPASSRPAPPPSVFFDPPSYDDGIGNPNFVLRAVRIPNGIQAVRVDPATGRVYERLMYPLYLRHDGHPAYDRNILLHNDDVSDDDATRDDNSGYFDMPFPGRPYRGVRNPPPGDSRDVSRRYNSSYTIDDKSLSEPTAKDIAWVHHQLSFMEGFKRPELDNRITPFRDPSFSQSDQFNSDRPLYARPNPNSRIRSLSSPDEFDFSNPDTFSRNPRHSDGLSVEDSKEIPIKLEESSSNLKQTEVEGNISVNGKE